MNETVTKRGALAGVIVVVLATLAGCSVLASEQPAAQIGFENETAHSGVDYGDTITAAIGSGNRGVYPTDVDRDGWTDMVLTGGDRPALYHNENGSFERSGQLPAVDGHVKSATVTDWDGDGWDDLIFFRVEDAPVAFHNDEGELERTDVGIGNLTYPLGGATADYDGDGDEDLLVYQSGNWGNGKPAGYSSLTGTVADDNGNPNVLYENVGGEYRRVDDAGLAGTERWSLAASFVDLTGDGKPDVHVANDYNNDVLYVNQGDGTFEERLLPDRTARNGMASEVADVNGDGHLDIFTTNIELPLSEQTMGVERYNRIKRLYQYEIHSGRTKGNTLLINQGNGTFVDRAEQYGVRVGGWGWAASFADLDNDGERELIHATENIVRIDPENPKYTYPQVWDRDGDGFERVPANGTGLDENNARGMATIDYDRDGVLEYVSANYDAPVTVFDSTVPANTTSLQVEAVDEAGATVYGAEVTVEAGDVTTTVHQNSETDYMSVATRRHHVGLAGAESATVTVNWPDGTTTVVEDVAAGQYVQITREGVDTTYPYATDSTA